MLSKHYSITTPMHIDRLERSITMERYLRRVMGTVSSLHHL
ncbi:MAG TPA: hypothetical protein V6C84_25275 [Coleofasciculaceae cyanobacterium]